MELLLPGLSIEPEEVGIVSIIIGSLSTIKARVLLARVTDLLLGFKTLIDSISLH